jgi:O-antigen/teichoic acid export membrane protein
MAEASTLRSAGAEILEVQPVAAPVMGRRRGGVRYFVSALISQACALLRYVVLARLLGPEQLGIAATLVVTASFFDLISDIGSDRFLIQDREGGSPQLQKLVQMVAVGRGAMVALGLVVFAIPIAYFYNTPQLAKGLAILALSPLINGFMHFDNRRAQRDHDFRSEATSVICAELAGLTATLVAAWLTHAFTAILFGVITRAVVAVLASHLLAKRRYALGWDRQNAPRLARFGAPLLLNGLMLFVVSQGDRVIVGHELGVKALGYYSAVMLLIYYPAGLLVRYLVGINIPLIAAQRDHPRDRDRAIDAMGGNTLLLAVGMASGFAVVAPPIIPLLFGARFAQAPLLVGLIGCLQTARFMLTWPTTVALATGRTGTVLLSNLAHGFAFVGAYVGLRLVGGMAGLVSGFLAGEMLATALAMMLVNRNNGRALTDRFDRLGVCIATYCLVISWNIILGAGFWWGVAVLAPASIALATWIYLTETAVIHRALATARGIAAPLWLRLARPVAQS